MRCPFLEEMLVAFCRAYPVKKMIPCDRIQDNCVCTCEGFTDCALFREVMAKLGQGDAQTTNPSDRDTDKSAA